MKKVTKLIVGAFSLLSIILIIVVIIVSSSKSDKLLLSNFLKTEEAFVSDNNIIYAGDSEVSAIKEELKINMGLVQKTRFSLGTNLKWINEKQNIFGQEAWCAIVIDHATGLLSSIQYFFVLNQAGDTEFPELYSLAKSIEEEYGSPTEQSVSLNNSLSKSDLTINTFKNPKNASQRLEERWILPQKLSDTLESEVWELGSVKILENRPETVWQVFEQKLYEYPGLWMSVWPVDKETGTWLVKMDYQVILELKNASNKTGW